MQGDWGVGWIWIGKELSPQFNDLHKINDFQTTGTVLLNNTISFTLNISQSHLRNQTSWHFLQRRDTEL